MLSIVWDAWHFSWVCEFNMMAAAYQVFDETPTLGDCLRCELVNSRV